MIELRFDREDHDLIPATNIGRGEIIKTKTNSQIGLVDQFGRILMMKTKSSITLFIMYLFYIQKNMILLHDL